MSDEFEITWQADDGYVGGSRPHFFTIKADELDDVTEDGYLEKIFWDYIQDDFDQKVHATSEDQDRFVAWAKEKIAEKGN